MTDDLGCLLDVSASGRVPQATGVSMPSQVKKVLQWIFWIFVIYAIFTSPDRAADIVRSIWDIIANGFHNLAVFFDRVLQR